MDIIKLARLVKNCRRAQTQLFRQRHKTALEIARDYERRVDKAIAEVLASDVQSLFADNAKQSPETGPYRPSE